MAAWLWLRWPINAAHLNATVHPKKKKSMGLPHFESGGNAGGRDRYHHRYYNYRLSGAYPSTVLLSSLAGCIHWRKFDWRNFENFEIIWKLWRGLFSLVVHRLENKFYNISFYLKNLSLSSTISIVKIWIWKLAS